MMARLLPNTCTPSVFELDLDGLRRAGICGLIFDLDNTLGPWGFTAWDREVLDWLAEVVEHRGFQVGFLSNDAGEGREAVRAAIGDAPFRFGAAKPRRGGYRQILHELGLAADEAAMVGDQIFTDVLGAKRVGLYTVLVSPFDPSLETRSTRVKRWLERRVLRLGGY